MHGDPNLARRLDEVEPDRFAVHVAAIAAELGYPVEPDEIDAAVAGGRSAWGLRWIR